MISAPPISPGHAADLAAPIGGPPRRPDAVPGAERLRSTGAPLLEVAGLERCFGSVRAVQGVSFSLGRGQVVGFIGANGAGKTTTMRMMATLELPDAGSITIGGYDAVSQPLQARRLIGWMPDHYGTYPNMTVWEYLDFFARAYGYAGAERQQRIADVMAFTDLDVLAERPMNKLSKGMAQRLCLGRALIHDPAILILDEPAAGLDPKARLEFKRLVRVLAEDGKTLFISSHILSELGEMCDHLIFIDRGRIVHQGTPDSLSLLESGAAQELVYRLELVVSAEVAEAEAEAAEPEAETAAAETETETALREFALAETPEAEETPERSLGDREAAGTRSLRQLEEWIAEQPDVGLIELMKSGALISLRGPVEVVPGVLKRALLAGLPICGFSREKARLEDAFVNLVERLQAGQEELPVAPPAKNGRRKASVEYAPTARNERGRK